jgi:hypothetical protein
MFGREQFGEREEIIVEMRCKLLHSPRNVPRGG